MILKSVLGGFGRADSPLRSDAAEANLLVALESIPPWKGTPVVPASPEGADGVLSDNVCKNGDSGNYIMPVRFDGVMDDMPT